MNKWLFAAISGIIQGLAEFLPISSSGHLSLFQNFFGMEDIDMTFDIMLHLGTLAAVFIVYRKDIFPLFPAFFSLLGKIFKGKFKLNEATVSERLVLMVIIATIPLVAIVPFTDYVDLIGKSNIAIGCILIFNGVMLFVSDRLSSGNVNGENIKPRNAIIAGIFQMFAVLPGLSRSGSTITGGLTQGFNREYAVKFSFIMSIPAILGAAVTDIPNVLEGSVRSADILPFIFGTLVAFASGIGTMKLLIYISRKSNFKIFSIYCVLVGILIIILQLTGIKFA
ncbi:MAG: undecaprenyl-diphosphate phosphatase [Ruminococcaceae bacterium]|nr:undecaprenyl-diphosphate phosphatase [Oscillospiraceae bacterium]